MAAKEVILCVDRGTSELKAVLFDLEGRSCGMERRKCSTVSRHLDWREADLAETYRQLVDAVGALAQRAQAERLRIVCISITSYMSGTIFLDQTGEPVGPAVLWNDSRTKGLMEDWRRRGVLDQNFDLTGSQILTGWPIPLLSWWKQNEPEVLSRARVLLSMKDYLRYRMTGTICTDVTEAVLSPGDVRSRGYAAEVLRLFDVSEYERLLPPAAEPEASAGALTEEAARNLGLQPGIPVVVGIGDMPGGVLGAGTLLSGHGASVLGTTFLNGLVLDRPQMEPYGAGMTSAFIENRILRMVNNTGGAAINSQWFLDQFFQREKQEAGESGIFSLVDRLLETVEPGSHGVLYHPYINSCGVTAPFLSIGARAQFTGIGLHTTREDMLRAIYEGIGFAMRDCYSSVPETLQDITVTGGASSSAVLCQLLADICGVPVRLPQEKEATALGAGIVGAVGIGAYSNYTEAVWKMVHFSKTFFPCFKNKDVYDKLFQLYFEIRNSMRGPWELRQQIDH